MFKIDLLNYRFTAILLLILSYTLVAFEVTVLNNLYFLGIALFAILQNYYPYKFKKVISGLIALASFYIQFVLNDYTLSKEYFINLILILVFLKYSELEIKENYFFFNYTVIFFAISTLLYGQDLISSINSLLIIILSIIQLYSLNQQKVLSLNLKYLFRYLAFGLSILPIIAIIYLIFPRAEINLKLFETKQNSLGIPDKISLGSFENISNSDEDVFIFASEEKNKREKYYFRVKVFNLIDRERNWVSTNDQALLSKYASSIKIKQPNIDNEIYGKLILNPHEKKWIPKLSNHNFDNSSINFNLFDNLSSSDKKIIKKTALNLYKQETIYSYDKKLIDFYTTIPENFSKKLLKWSKEQLNQSQNEIDYLGKILNEFANKEYYYSLSPQKIGNDYEKFFFETKTGYCEYYAGTFTILSRLAGIPARIVSGYYGGNYNSVGDFYTFKQQDAHSWVEVYLNNQWVLFDPTNVIPQENIITSNNENFTNETSLVSSASNNEAINIKNIKIYFDYVNYVWTNNFIKYDDQSRKQFIENKLQNKDLIQNAYLFMIGLIIIFSSAKFLQILITRKIYFNLFFNKIKKIKNLENTYLTHQELFNSFNIEEKNKWGEIIKFFEITKFSKNKKIKVCDFFKINLRILKI